MKIREIIKKKQLPFEEERNQVNQILTKLFNSKQKELEEALEETCDVNSPLTFMQHRGGIDSTYYFGTQWGTVKVYIGDSPEDSKVQFLENQILGLINKPVETTNEQPIVYKAVRRIENVGEYIHGRGGFFELIELYDEDGKVVTKSLCTHPEGHFSFLYKGVEYYSLPHSHGSKPVYHRLVV